MQVNPKETRAWVGVGRRDITPPFGIYGPVWGASRHDGQSRGTHAPLYVTALSIRAPGEQDPALLVGLDLATTGDLAGMEDAWLREEITRELGLPVTSLLLACSHTHGAPWAYRSRSGMPGGDRIETYLAQIRQAITEAGREAIETSVEAFVTFREGRCDLATNRNMPDPDDASRFLTGFNPLNGDRADDTLMVGRVCRVEDGQILATVVNYACHPTTLGPDNQLVSPDFVGTMREVMETHTGGAPNIFLQGASGDLAPAYQYVSDPRVAEKHGARLGHAAISTLLGMEAPGMALAYAGVIESGAPLAYWEPRPYEVPFDSSRQSTVVGLPAKAWPGVQELTEQLAAEEDPSMRERIRRKLTIASFADGRPEIPTSVHVWRFGAILFVGISCEIDVQWQKDLRRTFLDHAVVAMTDVNYSAIGYVVEEAACDLPLYQAWQPPYAKGSYTKLLSTCKELAVATLS